jgi:hypothetical protein
MALAQKGHQINRRLVIVKPFGRFVKLNAN